MSYESPISISSKIFFESMIDDMRDSIDEEILKKAIIETRINVDKDELVKALRYDRQQYEKGFVDGKKEVYNRRHGYWMRSYPTTPKSYIRICSVCKQTVYSIGITFYPNCPFCLSIMDRERKENEK